MQFLSFYLRVVLAYFWFLGSSFVATLITFFRWKDPSMGAVFARILAWGGLPIFGLRVRVENQQRLYVNQPCIYVSNHQSNMDIFTMSAAYPYRTVVIGKKEIKWLPIFGWFFNGSGNIMIDRSNRAHSMAGLEAAARYARDKGISIWIFPEGTRNRGKAKMLPFKKGAFHLAITAQVPVVPMVHQYLKSYLDISKSKIHYGEVLIKVLEPISTVGMTTADVPRLLEETRRRMEAALEAPELKFPQHLEAVPSLEPKARV